MSKKSKATIDRNLRQLRELIDTTDDAVLARVAYEIETAVRWATEDTVGWPGLVDQAISGAYLINREIKQ